MVAVAAQSLSNPKIKLTLADVVRFHVVMTRYLFVILTLCAFPSWAQGTIASAGRIEQATGGGTCSAVLVQPDVIATAAHCNADSKLVFRLGDGVESEPFEIVELIAHPLYEQTKDRVDWKLRFDIAVGRLAKPVPVDLARPYTIGDEAKAGERLFIVSWRSDGSDRPRQRACPVFNGIPGLVTLGCRVQGGESGAPVLRKTEDGLELVAIISSRTRRLEQPVAQASDVRLRLPPLFDLVEATSP